jgi:hypothetical protein
LKEERDVLPSLVGERDERDQQEKEEKGKS